MFKKNLQVLAVAVTVFFGACAHSHTPEIEVVFVLDTTGSMGGLIQGAKGKIWSIANTLAQTRPAPEIRMGLIGYRDRGDAYVTTLTQLTDDLDAVYGQLMQFQAQGGGDGPESVNQALAEAVNNIQWSKGRDVYRVIYLVGDAPPHMDYQQDVKFHVSCRKAARRDIVINTIQCGNDPNTTPVWKKIARLGHGQYFRTQQSGGAVCYSTPYDDELASYSRSLDDTRVYYGDRKAMRRAEAKKRVSSEIYAEASAPAIAARSSYNAGAAGAKNLLGDNELVYDITEKGKDLSKIKKEHLPLELRKKSDQELEIYLKEKAKKRAEIQAKIAELSKQRQQHITKQIAAKGGTDKDSFDAQIFDSIKTQAAEKGIEYEGELLH